MSRPKRILIVGGGPSGAHLGKLLAAAGKDVLLLADEDKSKLFYETLSSRAILGHTVPAVRGCAGSISFWEGNSQAERPGFCSPWGNDFFVARPGFEQELRKQATTAGAREQAGRVISVLGRDRHWEVQAASGEVYRGSILIDAAGRNSGIGRYVGTARHHRDRLIAVPFHLVRSEWDPKYLHHVTIAPDENGWWYIGPAPENQVFAVYYTDADLLRGMKLSDLKVTWQNLRGRVGLLGLELAASERALPATTAIVSKFTEDRWYAIGDAVATFDPLSSFGLTFAIQSAELVAGCILGTATAATYKARVSAWVLEYVVARREAYRRQTRWSTNPFWQRRASRQAA